MAVCSFQNRHVCLSGELITVAIRHIFLSCVSSTARGANLWFILHLYWVELTVCHNQQLTMTSIFKLLIYGFILSQLSMTSKHFCLSTFNYKAWFTLWYDFQALPKKTQGSSHLSRPIIQFLDKWAMVRFEPKYSGQNVEVLILHQTTQKYSWFDPLPKT